MSYRAGSAIPPEFKKNARAVKEGRVIRDAKGRIKAIRLKKGK